MCGKAVNGKEGNGSRCFCPKKGWEAESSQELRDRGLSNTETAFGEGEIWGWERMGQEKVGLNWGKREGK